ncbi:MAG: helix-turn-helix domain-containing protein [Planctomycetota bacterium]|jgi:IclR family KDG regulon transcriptional repressor|nr:helix-turn-helix domain-containing protein [Planctomycetota bacterium]
MRDNTIPAVTKAMRVMGLLAVDSDLSQKEIADRLAIASTTCFRLLQTLAAQDWVRQERGLWRLSGGLRPLLAGFDDQRHLVRCSEEPMRELGRVTGLSIKLSVAEGAMQLTLHKVESSRAVSLTGRVGARYAVVLGGTAAALHADRSADEIERIIAATPDDHWRVGDSLPEHFRSRGTELRARGTVGNFGVHAQGIDTVAAPIRDGSGRVIAAISILGLRGDFAKEAEGIAREAILVCTSNIERNLPAARGAAA